jgi:hypothetical protein
VGCDVGVTREDDLVGGSERQVDKETVGCDVGMSKGDDLVGGSERQVDKETVGCDVGVTKKMIPPTRSSSLVTPTSHPTVSLSTCLSDPPTGSSSLVTPTSHPTVSINLPLRSTNYM